MANKDIQKEIGLWMIRRNLRFLQGKWRNTVNGLSLIWKQKSAIGNRDIRCGSYREIQVFRPRLYLNQSMGIWGAISMI